MSNVSAGPNSALDALVGQVADEFTERFNRGERPDVEDYARRYPEIADLLRQLLPALEVIGPPSGTPDPSDAARGAPDSLAGCLGDFRLLREIGRGGMGIVYEAEQISLNRRVALKVLPFAATMDPRQLQRFQNEARAAAGLDHPHIVPVHGCGCERGVHYFAMRFIDGQALAQLIGQQRRQAAAPGPTIPGPGSAGPRTGDRPDGPSPSPPAMASAQTATGAASPTEPMPRDAGYFRRAAEWGIQAAEALEHAHQVGIVHRDVKPSNLLLDGRGNLWVADFGLARLPNDPGMTMTGDLVGTLRYMSPEQALARRGIIDHRTDVYALGATLYELLTLQPVHAGKDRQELLQQIGFEEPRPLRRLNRAIPAELETIVLKTLEKTPHDRYATAQELAEDLRRWLDDRPIQARKPSLLQRLRKWRRRHRPLVASLAVGMLALLVVGAVLAFGYQRRLAETERRVTAALVQAETLVDEGDKLINHPARWQATARLALSALEKAEELLATGTATASLTRRVDKNRAAIEAALADSALLVELNRIRLEQATLTKGRFNPAQSAPRYAKVFRDYGVDLAVPASAGARLQGSRLREALVAALEDWWLIEKDKRTRQRLDQLLQVANATNGFRVRWRKAMNRRESAALVKMATNLETQRLSAAVVCSRAADLKSLKQWSAAERLLKAAQTRDPGDFWLNHDLGMVIQEKGPARAEEAIGYLRAALALQSDSPFAYLQLGLALEDKGDIKGAIRCCRAALTIDLNYGHAHVNLGVLLMKKGDLDGAIKCYKRAIKIDPKNAYAHNNLGYVLRSKGNVQQGITCFKRAIAIDPKYDSPYNNLSAALHSMGRFDAAIAWCRKAIAIDPKMAVYSNLGSALRAKGKLDEAIVCYRKAIAINPKDTNAHTNLGQALKAKGKFDEAIAYLRRAVAIKPNNPHFHSNLSTALKLKGRLDEAVAECQKALRLDKDLPEAHCNLGHALLCQGKFVEALKAFRRGDALGRQRRGWRYPSANWVRGAKQLIALEATLKASDADPKKVRAYCDLGAALQAKGAVVEAMAFFRKAIAIDPKFAGAHYNLGKALRQRNDLDGAIAAYKKAIALDPNFAEAHCNLGDVLSQSGRFSEAAASFKRGHELGSRRPHWPYPSARWLRNAERAAALASKLPAFLRSDYRPRDNAERLGLAQVCMPTKHYPAAARLYADVFASEPKLADDLKAGHRYSAACAAALAGCGQGKDADRTDDQKRRRLRRQALKWLRADLAAYHQMLEKEPGKNRRLIVQQMQHWQADTDFASVRGEALAKLPAAERKAWRQLWTDVANLLARAKPQAAPQKEPDRK
jgi:tetratricopeptide (TPR) repeat protein